MPNIPFFWQFSRANVFQSPFFVHHFVAEITPNVLGLRLSVFLLTIKGSKQTWKLAIIPFRR
jgi:hypothetical protein